VIATGRASRSSWATIGGQKVCRHFENHAKAVAKIKRRIHRCGSMRKTRQLLLAQVARIEGFSRAVTMKNAARLGRRLDFTGQA
jgi:hypothetical protein